MSRIIAVIVAVVIVEGAVVNLAILSDTDRDAESLRPVPISGEVEHDAG